jgi:alkanesulfonate monooxygenase SsuD/methylene tetrahydromethanopterin reductase-like flavin-dependent oxidoreductase (luciferase family)
MKYAIYTPNFGDGIDPRSLVDLAKEAESCGWDGFFLWDHMLANKSQKMRVFDPWVVLAGIAMATSKIRLGTTITPLARRRPWKLARETVTLDHLSGGRLILGAGLGEPPDADFSFFGDESSQKGRAERLDEGLEILAGLWRGKPFHFSGKHYQIEKVTFLPKPVQEPRIPVWVGGFWPNPAPYHRAARWDGVIPLKHGGWIGPEDVQEILTFIRPQRKPEALFDVAVIGSRPSLGKMADAWKKLRDLAEAGTTWWLEAFYLERQSAEKFAAHIRQGPPG